MSTRPTITFRVLGILPDRPVILESVGGDVCGRYTHRLDDEPRPAADTALDYRHAIAAAAHRHGAPVINAAHLTTTTAAVACQ